MSSWSRTRSLMEKTPGLSTLKAREIVLSEANMPYVILGCRTDDTLTELARTSNEEGARAIFSEMQKHSYKWLKLVHELDTK